MDIGIKRGRVKWPDPQRVVLDEAVPALVARDLWKAPQTHDGTRRFGDGRPWKRPYLLSGLIPCGQCAKGCQAHKPVRRPRVPLLQRNRRRLAILAFRDQNHFILTVSMSPLRGH